MDEKKAKAIAKKAIIAWAKAGKRPKIADIGAKGDIGDVLKKGSLAEALNLTIPRSRTALVDVSPRFFKKILREIRETSQHTDSTQDRMLKLAGII